VACFIFFFHFFFDRVRSRRATRDGDETRAFVRACVYTNAGTTEVMEGTRQERFKIGEDTVASRGVASRGSQKKNPIFIFARRRVDPDGLGMMDAMRPRCRSRRDDAT
jgi:hypothetical protein